MPITSPCVSISGPPELPRLIAASVWMASSMNAVWLVCTVRDRKSTRLNSSHGYISYVVFCLKKNSQNALVGSICQYNAPGMCKCSRMEPGKMRTEDLSLFFHHSSYFLVGPHPVAHFWHIFEILADIRCVFLKQLVALSDQRLGQPSHACGPSHRLNAEVIAARLIEHDHIEGRGGRSLFIKTAHVETRRIRTAMDDLVNRPRIAVEGKQDWFVFREVLNEGGFIHSVRMDLWWVERHEVHDVDHAHLQFWQMLA